MSIPSYFDEDAYLFYNPDVAAAIAAGAIPSGYHHWLYHGWKECRAGAPRPHAIDRRIFVRRFEARPYGVNLFGPLSTPSGLGEAARSSRTALRASMCPMQETNVAPWGTESERIPPPVDGRYRINLIHQNMDMIPLFVRAYGEEVLHGAYNIGFWFWELPAARADWAHYCEYVDEIWVASEFCRRAFACVTRLSVVTMPVVVEGLEKLASYGREHFGLPPSTFTFGYIYDVNSYIERKNPVALVEAFRREFGDSRDVLLVLKQSDGGGPRNPDATIVERAVAEAANIRVIDAEFSDDEIVSFQNALDCFVSPHRSEGFGFNLAQSMYLRKPVIATGYSGNVDFMDDRNSYVLDYRLVTIEQTVGPYIKGAVWADPDTDHLRALLRCVFENAAERNARGAAAVQTIRNRFSSEEAHRQMQGRFRDLGLDQPPVRRSLFSQHLPRFAPPDAPPEVLRHIR